MLCLFFPRRKKEAFKNTQEAVEGCGRSRFEAEQVDCLKLISHK